MQREVKVTFYLKVECESEEGARDAAEVFIDACHQRLENGLDCEAMIYDLDNDAVNLEDVVDVESIS